MFDYSQITKLTDLQQVLLCFIAHYGKEPSGELMEKLCREFGIKSSFETMMAIRQLTTAGYLCISDKSEKVVSDNYRLKSLCYLFECKEEWVEIFSKINIYGRVDIDACSVVDFAKSFTAGVITDMAFMHRSNIDLLSKLLCPLIDDPSIQQAIQRMSQPTFRDFSQILIPWLLEHDINSVDAVLSLWENRNIQELQNEWQDALLYHFYATGKVIEDSHNTWQQHVIQAILALQQGLDEQGLTEFKTAKSLCQTKSGFVPFPDFISCYFYVLALSRDNGVQGRFELNNISNNYKIDNTAEALVVQLLADYLKDSKHYVNDRLLRSLLDLAKGGQFMGYACMSFLLSSHMKRFRDIDLNSLGYRPNMWIFRNELAPFMPILLAEQEQLSPVFAKSKSINTPVATNTKQASTVSPTQTQNNQFLIYVVAEDFSVVPYSMETGLPDGITRFNRISNADYRAGRIPKTNVNNADRQIWNMWYRSDCVLTLAMVHQILDGSDKLYIMSQGAIHPAKLVLDAIYIEIELEERGYCIASNYTALQVEKSSSVLYRISGTTIFYSPVPVQYRSDLYALLSNGFYPFDSEERLRNLVLRLRGAVIVKGDSYAAGGNVPEMDGVAHIVVQVTDRRNSKNIRLVKLMVRPCENQNMICVPGEGASMQKVYLNGRRVSLRRDLNQEKVAAQNLIEYLKSKDIKVIDDGKFVFPLSTQEMLLLMEFVQSHSVDYSMEWKTAAPYRLTEVKGTDFHLGIRQRENWLELEGEVTLDENHRLSVREFFNVMLNQNNSGFIQLGENHFMRLTEKLRQQVERLASGFHDNGHRLLAKELSAVQITDAIDGEIEVGNSSLLLDLQEKMKIAMQNDFPIPSDLCATLRPYQYDGFVWMNRLSSIGAGACLADDMGLGKTLQSISFMLYRSEEGPSLVIAPASVVKNWESELRKFAPTLNPIILNAVKNRDKKIAEARPGDVIIATYGLLVSMSSDLSQREWCVICLDEAHTIKNKTTQTSVAAMALQSRYRLALTGTPIQNNLSELWNIFQFLNPGLLGGYESFSRKFVLPIMNNQNLDRQEQLKRIIAPFMLRRTKSEVAHELPKKEERTILVHLNNGEMEAYEHLRQEIQVETKKAKDKKNGQIDILSQITKLRLAACATNLIANNWTRQSSKLAAFQITLNEIMQEPDSRLLVFSQFTSFLKMVGELLKTQGLEFLYLDGNVPIKERYHLVNRFQWGECSIFLISLQAGGLGLNLTQANHVILMDPWWNPAIEQQAIDRAYRIGQQRDVKVIHLISANTIEEKIVRLQRTKRDMATALLTGEEMTKGVTYEDLVELINI